MAIITDWEDFNLNYGKYKDEPEIKIDLGEGKDCEIFFDSYSGEIQSFLTFLLSRPIIFNNDIRIKGGSKIEFKNWKINKCIRFDFNAPVTFIEIFDCEINGNIYFLSNAYIQSLWFMNVKFKEIEFNNNIEDIKLTGCIFGKIIFSNIDISSENKGTRVKILYLNKEKTSIGDVIFKQNFKINELYINGGKFYKPYFKSLDINNVSFRNKEYGYYLRNFSCNNLRFAYFSNISEIFKISNIEVKDEFIVNDGDFGRANFNNLILNNIFFKGIVLNDCIFNNVLWYNYNFLQKSKNGLDSM
ncbi:MAG: hypothetical protein Q8K26_04690, partial [Candidatus Gracilibacteria bacterium]|nr:hypothetical protein [Candidatus Gracilibacteria bacterium]